VWLEIVQLDPLATRIDNIASHTVVPERRDDGRDTLAQLCRSQA
jgi:hypothetical protein